MSEAIIAVDIGTTNIEAVLCGTDRSVIDHKSERNEQRRFGSDVASRICAAAAGHEEEMHVSVLSQICGLITNFTVQHPDFEIKHVAIAGNTTMLHILSGYDCSGLGMYPFETVSLAKIDTTTHGLVNDYPIASEIEFPDIPVTILPGISAYIGADIYAGTVACGFAGKEEVCMLIDLGTNAEIMLGNKDRILTASAAAGPAFESGRIFKGTEGIEMMHRLLELGVIDRTGLMKDEYFEQSAQKNIRKLQLAKAAIRAAITVLTEKYGKDPDKIYISGNFGNNINEKACISVGMLPESFAGKIVSAGNTVLEGCVMYLLDPASGPSLDKIEEIILANEPGFNDLLMGSIDL
ncbi:MAG: ASKHA domain-containing protein [Lachnospiraceae bacterium]|nr:ASKHA domain-containing protein [Lachnospiraceae bacterium]